MVARVHCAVTKNDYLNVSQMKFKWSVQKWTLSRCFTPGLGNMILPWILSLFYGRKNKITPYNNLIQLHLRAHISFGLVFQLNVNGLYIYTYLHLVSRWNVNRTLGNEHCETDLNPIQKCLRVNCGSHTYVWFYFLSIFIMTKKTGFSMFWLSVKPPSKNGDCLFAAPVSVHFLCFTFNVSPGNVWESPEKKKIIEIICIAWDTTKWTEWIKQSRTISIEIWNPKPIIFILSLSPKISVSHFLHFEKIQRFLEIMLHCF